MRPARRDAGLLREGCERRPEGIRLDVLDDDRDVPVDRRPARADRGADRVAVDGLVVLVREARSRAADEAAVRDEQDGALQARVLFLDDLRDAPQGALHRGVRIVGERLLAAVDGARHHDASLTPIAETELEPDAPPVCGPVHDEALLRAVREGLVQRLAILVDDPVRERTLRELLGVDADALREGAVRPDVPAGPEAAHHHRHVDRFVHALPRLHQTVSDGSRPSSPWTPRRSQQGRLPRSETTLIPRSPDRTDLLKRGVGIRPNVPIRSMPRGAARYSCTFFARIGVSSKRFERTQRPTGLVGSPEW